MNKSNFFLLLAVCVSAFSVVMQQNQYRLNFTALDKAKKQEIALEQDYAQMRVQQARLANHEAIRGGGRKTKPPSAGFGQYLYGGTSKIEAACVPESDSCIRIIITRSKNVD
ncbi:cell division protein FtsL-related protein [Neisseria gonorrhoeae]|nr:cell division protein FtsL-related protein [Neisseria gonorrhoeae]